MRRSAPLFPPASIASEDARLKQFGIILRLVGLFIMVFSMTLVPSLAVSLYYQDGQSLYFALTLGATLLIGLLIWFPVRTQERELRTRDGFLIVVLFWTVLAVLGATPFIFSPHLSFTDAMFESMSGITTTGATVIVGLDQLPKSILYHRQQLHAIGGMGVVVLAVAVLPMLGVGGMQLYQAEAPGPIKDTKLTPRIAQTARVFWYIYLTLTIACALAYWLAGMSLFDAICHSFSTVATGGFSTHDASLAYFNSATIEMIAIVFMLLGALNFSIHFIAWRDRNWTSYFHDEEIRTFIAIVFAISVVIAVTLVLTGTYNNWLDAIRYSTFHVVSIITTTGFLTADFSLWPLFIPVLLIFISFIGGCGGSTSGGMKVIRIMVMYRQGLREILRLIHPRAIISVKIGGKPIPYQVADSIWGFFSLYIITTALLTLALMGTGEDFTTAFSAVAACINLSGPGLGEVIMNFTTITPVGKWLLTFAMLLGRLEIFTLLVLFSPAFWRR